MEDNMKKNKNSAVVLSMTALTLAISTQVNAAPSPLQLSATNQQIDQQSPLPKRYNFQELHRQLSVVMML